MKTWITAIICFWLIQSGCSQYDERTDVIIETELGNIEIALYDSTPNHKAAFIRLVKDGYFDSLTFYRGIAMRFIGGGKSHYYPSSHPDSMLSSMKGHFLLPEVQPALIHKRGTLTADVFEDPFLASTISRFIIINSPEKYQDKSLDTILAILERNRAMHFQRTWINRPANRVYLNTDLQKLEKKNPDSAKKIIANIQKQWNEAYEKEIRPWGYTPEQRKIYAEIGGMPVFDGIHTAFGEVVKGIEVVDKISESPVENQVSFKNKVKMKVKLARPN